MRPHPAILVAFSGLPGTGKTTLSARLAPRLGAMHLRIDIIEQAMRAAGVQAIGPAGYAVAIALAEANLRAGLPVVADCVNQVRESRQGWQAAAARAGVPLAEIHLLCSDPAEHRRRVEGRRADIPGHVLPGWDAVLRHEFEPRGPVGLVLDTAGAAPGALVERALAHVLGVAAACG